MLSPTSRKADREEARAACGAEDSHRVGPVDRAAGAHGDRSGADAGTGSIGGDWMQMLKTYSTAAAWPASLSILCLQYITAPIRR